jgi:hypothetical protein
MTTPFYSTDCTPYNGVPARTSQKGKSLVTVSGEYTTLTKLIAADVIHMVRIPAGATLLDLIFDCAVMDASAALTLSVGYTGALQAFINTSTVGQAGGLERISVVGGTQKAFTAADTIQVSVETGPTDTTLAKMKLTVLYTMDP